MRNAISEQLEALGLRAGDAVMVHSSFKSLGVDDPETVLTGILDLLGPSGTLMMPALSYCQKPPAIHDTRFTPGCVGFLPEYFRNRRGTLRSLHPTHSVCAVGADAGSFLGAHDADTTPCGSHSPFRLLLERQGKILMLGCGLRPNTSMNAIEELVEPPYLYGPECEYTLTDASGKSFQKTYVTHGFRGYEQRYDRVAEVLEGDFLKTGTVGTALCHLIDGEELCRRSLQKMKKDPLYFVDQTDG